MRMPNMRRRSSSRELLGTYEAQMVRALGEIDQALNLVKYLARASGGPADAEELKDKGLLPADLLFIVSIADREGNVRGKHPRGQPAQSSPIRTMFRAQRDGDVFFIGRLPRGPTGDATLAVQPRLESPSGAFDGVVIVAVGCGLFCQRL